MVQQIIFRSLWDDEHMVEYQVEARNEINSTTIKFYGNDDEFKSFGADLKAFPQSIDAEVNFGSSGDFLELRVFCYERTGHTAIHIKTDNLVSAPYNSKAEFCLLTYPASVNNLGVLLRHWDPRKVKEIVWAAE